MKTKSISTFAAIALLSVGTITALANPQGFQRAVSDAIAGEAAYAQSVGKLAKKLVPSSPRKVGSIKAHSFAAARPLLGVKIAVPGIMPAPS